MNNIQLINDLIISAFEGGSNYWYMLENKSLDLPYFEVIPNGGTLTVSNKTLLESEKDKAFEKVLNQSNLKQALDTFAEKYPKRWTRIVNDDDFDAEDADLFLQLAVIGEIRYG